MEDDLNFLEMEDDLSFVVNGSSLIFLVNGRQPQSYCKWKATSTLLVNDRNILKGKLGQLTGCG
jgi:hypothetical protein